jgi:hypothetical protein
MEDHHWGGKGWNSAVEPQEERKAKPTKSCVVCYNKARGENCILMS